MGKSTCYVFQRTEKKYLLNEQQYKALLDTINRFMDPDAYGKYSICNLYFDTDDYTLIRKSIEKPVFKEKLRLRSYGVPEDGQKVFLEIKRKIKGVVFKRRVSLPYQAMMRYIETGVRSDCDGQVFREIDYFMRLYHPKPMLFLSYDREAYKGRQDKGLRVTFDTNICFRQKTLDLQAGVYGSQLLESGCRLMEIKTTGAMPVWLCEALSALKIFPCSFSKYGMVYKTKLIKEKGA